MHLKKIIVAFLVVISYNLQAQDDVLTDTRDNNTYAILRVGNKIWMAENLKFKSTGAKMYDNNTGNLKWYGMLYSWDEANKVCPTGWHLPSDDEWKELEKALGIPESELNKDEFRGSGATELIKGGKTGFNVQMAGYFYDEAGKYFQMNQVAHFWTSSLFNQTYPWKRIFKAGSDQISRSRMFDKADLCSVRCVQD